MRTGAGRSGGGSATDRAPVSLMQGMAMTGASQEHGIRAGRGARDVGRRLRRGASMVTAALTVCLLPLSAARGANAVRPRRLEVWQTPGKLHAALLRGRARSRSAGGAKDRRGDCDRAAAAAQGTRDRRECRRGEPRQSLSSLSRHLRPVSGLQIDPGRLSGMDEVDAAVLPRAHTYSPRSMPAGARSPTCRNRAPSARPWGPARIFG